jgi:hypothetical protein
VDYALLSFHFSLSFSSFLFCESATPYIGWGVGRQKKNASWEKTQHEKKCSKKQNAKEKQTQEKV